MKLVLDEMWSGTIARELRHRGHDVIASQEPEHTRYAGIPDDEVFALAQTEQRTIVTDNVADFEQARLDWESRGQAHCGVIYSLNPPFNRHQGNVVIGQMVRALDALASSATPPPGPVHHLRPS